MGIKKGSHFLVILMFFCALFIFQGNQNSWGSVFPLDEENVFCIYYKMSGRGMYDQDLEELSRSLGRPTYTPFKPAEMFTKKSLRKLRYNLKRKIKKYDKHSLFKWGLKRVIKAGNTSVRGYKINSPDMEMPHPTPFIRSLVSTNGLKSINRVLDSLISEALSKRLSRSKKTALSITIYLRPEKIDYRNDERNIALEKVVLPHSYVIFYPVRLEISQSENPVKILTSQDFPKK